MIVEKPTWLRHAGLQIFSVDTQPNGFRFATAGGDHKVRISNMNNFTYNLVLLQDNDVLVLELSCVVWWCIIAGACVP